MGIAIIIDWYGPYGSKADLNNAMKQYWEDAKCLYMAMNSGGGLHYLGRTEAPRTRMQNHEKMAIALDCDFYCGNIVSQGVGGRRAQKCRTDLSTAEAALIASLDPKANRQGRGRKPEDCVVIYSRFWGGVDDEERRETPAGFPPLIAYDSYTDRWDAGGDLCNEPMGTRRS